MTSTYQATLGRRAGEVHEAILAVQNQDEVVYKDSEMLLIRLGGRGWRLTRSVSYPR